MARGSPALPVDRSLSDGWRVRPIRSGRRSARARDSDQAWIGTGSGDIERLRYVFAAGARRSPVLCVCSGAGNSAKPQSIVTANAAAERGPRMGAGRVDCRGDGARLGADGAGRIRAGVYSALLADGTGF